MTQLIITIAIVFAASSVAIYLIIKSFKKKPKKEDSCGGCTSDCSTCGVIDLTAFKE